MRRDRSRRCGSLGHVPEIAVIGSLNLDTTVRVPRLPVPGETVLGTGHFDDTGGKGANQAVAAARLGADVAMVGMVGADDAGARLRASLTAAGVDVEAVFTHPDLPTGMAVITVDESGENSIVVDPAANGALDPEALEAARETIAAAAIALVQLEIPIETVTATARMAEGTLILNPAPATALPMDLMSQVDVLVPNATELGGLVGRDPASTVDEAIVQARELRGPGAVVVTLGAHGAVAVADDDALHVPAPAIDAVDPTGAGDAFCGGLAEALVRGGSLAEAVEWAVLCGSVAATRWGAQASLPARSDVLSLRGQV